MKTLKFGYIELTLNGIPVPVNVRAIMNVKQGGYVSVKDEDCNKALVTFLDSSYTIFDEDWFEVQQLILKIISK